MKNKLKQYSHLSRSVLLEEQGTTLILRTIVWGILGVATLFIIWTVNMQLDEVAITTGEIIPDMRIQKVQHLSGGEVQEILVKNGDIVKKGQVLIKLNPVVVQSNFDENRAQLNSLLVRKERLKAFIFDKKLDDSKIPKEGQSLIDEQKLILKNAINSVRINKALLSSQIKQLNEEMSEFEDQKKALLAQYKLMDEEYKIQKQLCDKGIVAKVIVLRLERDKLELEEKVIPIPEKLMKMKEQLNELKLRREQVKVEAIQKSRTELEDINSQIPQLREKDKRYQYELDHLNVYATISGIIYGLNVHSTGRIIETSQTIMEIVPQNPMLVAEVHIESKDIGHIQVGEPAKVKLTTYDFGRYGSISGTLMHISASTYLDRNEVPYYIGIIHLNQSYIELAGKKLQVIPGMTLQADIKTGSKSLFQYLMKPVFKSASSALTER